MAKSLDVNLWSLIPVGLFYFTLENFWKKDYKSWSGIVDRAFIIANAILIFYQSQVVLVIGGTVFLLNVKLATSFW